MPGFARVLRTLLILFLGLCAIPLIAQQTGSISGKVTASDGSALPGVTVEARSNVLPGPRVTVTSARGEYRFPALPPGAYTVKFTFSGMTSVTRNAAVQLDRDTVADVSLGMQAVSESATVTAEASLVDKVSATIANGISSQELKALPIAQDYRDLQKLIPAVQYTEDTVRGPSAGASGQDNVYLFDGASVSLPLFGNLSAEPASHDVAQVTVIKGGARAVDFDRAGGFWIDSVSKSGTSDFHGEVQLPVPEREHVRRLEQRHPVPVRAGPKLVEREPGGPDSHGSPLFLRFLLPARAAERQPGQPVRGAAALRQHSRRRFRQADDQPEPGLDFQPELPRRQARGRKRPFRLQRLGDDGHRQRGGAENRHRRRVVDHQPEELRHDEILAFREPDAGPAGLHLQRRALVRGRHATGRRQLGPAGSPDGADPGRRQCGIQRVRCAIDHQVRLHRQRSADRRRDGGVRKPVRPGRLLPRFRAGRLQPHARRRERDA